MGHGHASGKNNDIESVRKELEWRNTACCPLKVKQSDVEAFTENIKNNILKTVLCLSAMTLRDEFGFGKDRLQRFADRFWEKTACLTSEYVSWDDISQTLMEETGLVFEIPDGVKKKRETATKAAADGNS